MLRYLFILSLLCGIDQQNFQIEFLGISAAEVQLHSIDTLYDKQNAKLIHFQTESKGLVKYLFNVDNHYTTIISQDFNKILSFNKNTEQPNVINNIHTSRQMGETVYNNSSTIIPDKHFNIFSLLYFLSNNKITETQIVHIEREGNFYNGSIVPIDILNNNRILYRLELDKKHDAQNTSIIEKTDIFTWALFKDQAKREILVDYNTNNIISCMFKVNGIAMKAYNNKYME